MINIHYSKTILKLPEKWDELSAKQYIAIAGILHRKKINESFLQMQVLKVLSNKTFFGFYFLPIEMRIRCFEYIQWVFKGQKFTKQLIPKYKSLYGPAAFLTNLSIEEFHYCEMSYHIFLEEQSEGALNDLVAVLYRKPKENYNKEKNDEGDVRIAFNVYNVNHDAKKTAKWKRSVKLAILMWYASCKNELTEVYPHVFDGVKPADNYYDGMYKMIRALSGQKYGSFKEVEKLNLHLALKEANESAWEAKELKRKYPKMYE